MEKSGVEGREDKSRVDRMVCSRAHVFCDSKFTIGVET